MSTPRSAIAVLALALGVGCGSPTPPPTRELIHLHGSPYERGLQHGQQLRSKVRAFYTTLLTSSLLPYLNREQPGIAAFLPAYRDAAYVDGQFSYQLLLDSALAMQHHIPVAYQQEMHGIADGAGMTYEQILVLNTFADTTLAVRGVALALQLSSAPHLERVEFIGAGGDGVDNDGDGATDEPSEGVLDPYVPSPTASMVELPATLQVRLVLRDAAGIDTSTLRLALDGQVFTSGDPALTLTPTATALEVVLTPPALSPASVHSLSVLVGNNTVVTDPPPSHPRLMREERITFTTRGLGKLPREVPNRGVDDARTRPTSIAFAATGTATTSGGPLLAQHFTLLDANTAHNHTIVFVHDPDQGERFVTVGWAGMVWGVSGMNLAGQSYACQPSDTLDNAVVGHVIASIADLTKAKLVAGGIPIGILGRRILEETRTTPEAVALMRTVKSAYGWSCLLADAQGTLRAAELDANVDGQLPGGVADFGTDRTEAGNLDGAGARFGSLGEHDLRLTAHYLKNRPDMFSLTVQGKRIVPQPLWASSYFRSLHTYAVLGDALSPALGHLDVASAQTILATPDLVDRSDSMNATVYEPATRQLHAAIGAEPATDAPFETVDLRAELP
jgi:hypothetical protein